jgi:hypothetical protein
MAKMAAGPSKWGPKRSSVVKRQETEDTICRYPPVLYTCCIPDPGMYIHRYLTCMG